MSGDPPKEPSTDQPNTDSKPADRSTDQAGGGVSDRSSGPRAGEPNADASHFDESDQNADNAGTNADRRRAKADSIGMFGSNNSGYFVFGDVRTRKSCERAWQVAGVAGSRTDAGDYPGSQPGCWGGVAQAWRSSGLAVQGRNRSSAGPVGGFPPLCPHWSR
jgi:hypothetical protein